ncbi:starch synthase 4 chloroplastic/amyloplastic isoform X2 [Tripterygium wilfordii]|uniref:starch synthase n=1 Tax=Tripterygium wilfordii TaxID=458696 RepID=A0A7J7E2J9_TRIWF|nr:probable starch synthase 4, chloroplastic/amyloplastic [Tripterygium wilfordii]KAF5752761.1 starch synthase 4 chloroplastic/amyloplastic isoform X2 [Tripterygium wilfordii]
MAAELLTRFLCQGFVRSSAEHANVRFLSPSRRLLPASCKMRQRSFRSQNKRHEVKKASSEQPPTSEDLPPGPDEDSESINSSVVSPILDPETGPIDEFDDNVELEHGQHANGNNFAVVAVLDESKSLDINVDGREKLSSVHLEDLIGMIRNAEKNILLLNKARVRALEDLEKILTEKEALQEEINVLQIRLAETDEKIKIAAQEKIHMELLEGELEKLQDELTQRGGSGGIEMHDNQSKYSIEEPSPLHSSNLDSLFKELDSLREENVSLKHDIQALKEELSNVRNTDERIEILEKERSFLESSLKNLESKLSVSQKDVSNLSNLKTECKDLWKKVEDLQGLLDKANKQADQAILVLQQNQELSRKVDKLEESLGEANVYKLSSEKLQQYSELMQQKIKLLEEQLQKSDEEIHSYVQLYQESVQEFQDTLNSLKEESKKRAIDEPVDDMPWEFWSRLLLLIDGWLLEKKISMDDAKLLREMIWKRDVRIHDAYMACKEKNESEAVSIFLRLTSSTGSPGLYVTHIAAEMAPVAKVGGLGDVVTGLGKALQKRGHLVEIILPKYDCVQYDRIRDLRVLNVEVESYFDGKLFKNKIWVCTVEGLPVYFIEPHHPDGFFWRGQFYGERDDFKRFSYFSRAALEFLLQAGKKPDIIHCHDWQTAFVAPLYWDIYAPKGLNSARICFTCHNFEYQGIAPASELTSCGLDAHQLNRPDRMQDNSAHDRINPVKGAIVFSNIVTTVSPTYAEEVRTAEGGHGLHSTLNFHSRKFMGILNGIDTDAWNPATDTFLEAQYSANDILGKAENKMALRRHLGLSFADHRRPLVGCITRLVPQKGVHLIRHAIYRTLELGGQFVLLGSSPVPHIQREFEGIANHFENHEHIQLILKYDESLSHSIYAASDMFIIPSIFEPCGLTQMIAMRYGSIPIARKTGGLNDSVFDVDDDTIPLQFRNGFTFVSPDEQGINGALERAFNYYMNNIEGWQQLVQKDMSMNFSWKSSASQYEDLYLKSVSRAKTATHK